MVRTWTSSERRHQRRNVLLKHWRNNVRPCIDHRAHRDTYSTHHHCTNHPGTDSTDDAETTYLDAGNYVARSDGAHCGCSDNTNNARADESHDTDDDGSYYAYGAYESNYAHGTHKSHDTDDDGAHDADHYSADCANHADEHDCANYSCADHAAAVATDAWAAAHHSH